MTVLILGEVLEVFPASAGMEEKPFVRRGGSDLNSFVLFIQILTGACAPSSKGALKCAVPLMSNSTLKGSCG